MPNGRKEEREKRKRKESLVISLTSYRGGKWLQRIKEVRKKEIESNLNTILVAISFAVCFSRRT